MKKCKKCGAYKTRTKCKKKELVCKPCIAVASKVYRENHKESLKTKKQEYRKSNPDQWRNRNLVSNYGISLIEYNQKLEDQKGVCAVCKTQESSKRNVKLSVDHNHSTGKIRGLLCSRCNRSLGLLRDDFNVVLTMAKYLQEHDAII